MRTTCLGGLWRSFVLVPGIFAPASFILIAFSYNLNELFICNIWACTSVYTNSIYTTCEYRCTRRSSQLSCVLIIPNWFLVYASYQTSYVFTCNSNCHVSYYDLFCPYLKKKILPNTIDKMGSAISFEAVFLSIKFTHWNECCSV